MTVPSCVGATNVVVAVTGCPFSVTGKYIRPVSVAANGRSSTTTGAVTPLIFLFRLLYYYRYFTQDDVEVNFSFEDYKIFGKI